MKATTKVFSLLPLFFFVVACNSQVTPKDKGESIELVSITLSGDYQEEFELGEEFNYEGLIVTANYSDSSSSVVEPTSVSSPDMNVLGDQEVVVTYLDFSESYTINIYQEEYEGYIKLDTYRVEIDIAKNPKKVIYLNPMVMVNGVYDPTKTTFNCVVDVDNLIKVSKYSGTISPLTSEGYQNTGSCVVTVTCEEAPNLVAKCNVTLARNIPEVVKEYRLVNDYDSLKQGDILVMASPSNGVTASIDTLHSKLNPVSTTFSADKSKISVLGEGSAEFYLGIEEVDEEKMFTLEAQTGEYLVCTHQGKVKLDNSSKTNRFWDIHSNIDPETGEGSLSDGAVIENNIESLGYMMYNVISQYFTTYVDNSIRPGIMELPFLYRLEEVK